MKLYLVALRAGGVMEHPGFSYSDYDMIEAPSTERALQTYNEKHKCAYYYGEVMVEWDSGTVTIINKQVTYAQVDEFKKGCELVESDKKARNSTKQP